MKTFFTLGKKNFFEVCNERDNVGLIETNVLVDMVLLPAIFVLPSLIVHFWCHINLVHT